MININPYRLIVYIIWSIVLFILFNPTSAFIGLIVYTILTTIQGKSIIEVVKKEESSEEEHQEKMLNTIRFSFNDARNKQKKSKGKKYKIKAIRKDK